MLADKCDLQEGELGLYKAAQCMRCHPWQVAEAWAASKRWAALPEQVSQDSTEKQATWTAFLQVPFEEPLRQAW